MRSSLADLPPLPTTSLLALVFIVLIICMLAFRILAELALISSKFSFDQLESFAAMATTLENCFSMYLLGQPAYLSSLA